MDRFSNISKDAMAKFEEIANATRLSDLIHRQEEEEKQKNRILWIFALVGAAAAVAAIAYAVYRFLEPDYLDDYDEDYDDDADDEFDYDDDDTDADDKDDSKKDPGGTVSTS